MQEALTNVLMMGDVALWAAFIGFLGFGLYTNVFERFLRREVVLRAGNCCEVVSRRVEKQNVVIRGDAIRQVKRVVPLKNNFHRRWVVVRSGRQEEGLGNIR